MYINVLQHAHVQVFPINTGIPHVHTVEPLYKDTPEMRTPPLIRTLEAVPGVSRIEG